MQSTKHEYLRSRYKVLRSAGPQRETQKSHKCKGPGVDALSSRVTSKRPMSESGVSWGMGVGEGETVYGEETANPV